MDAYTVRCPVCGSALGPEAAYCPSCGTPRATGATGAGMPMSAAPAGSMPGGEGGSAGVGATGGAVAGAPEPGQMPYAPPSPTPLPSGAPTYPPAFGGAPAAYPPPPSYAPPPPGYAAGPASTPLTPGQPGPYAPPPGYAQPGYPPPSGYGVMTAYPGQPVIVQVQTRASSSGPVIAEVILGLFGIFGVGWLAAGKSGTGGLLLGLSLLWWVVTIGVAILTLGFGLCLIYPLDVVFVIVSAINLNRALR